MSHTTTPDAGRACDNHLVAALITRPPDAADALLCGILRAQPPRVYALPAGHPDGRDPDKAVLDVISRETGLEPLAIDQIDMRWSAEPCPTRQPGPHGGGHLWTYYRAAVAGTLTPDPAAAQGAWWMPRRQVERLIQVTVAYACGHLTDAEYAAAPGWEPAQLPALIAAGWGTATIHELILVENKARTWTPGEGRP